MAILRKVIKGLRRFIFKETDSKQFTITSNDQEALERAYREYYSEDNEVISR